MGIALLGIAKQFSKKSIPVYTLTSIYMEHCKNAYNPLPCTPSDFISSSHQKMKRISPFFDFVTCFGFD